MASPPDAMRGSRRALDALCVADAAAPPRLLSGRRALRGGGRGRWALLGRWLLVAAGLALLVACEADEVPAAEVVDAEPPLDAAPPDVAPPPDAGVPMGPCAAATPFARGDDGAWLAAEHTGQDAYQSRCGGSGGDDALLVFTAPQAGRWRFHVTSAEFDPILSARSDCVLAASERTCNDDIGWPRARSAAVQLDLAVDEVVYLVVDAYAGPDAPDAPDAVGGAFAVEAVRVTAQPPEAPCDPLGLADGCRAGYQCAADHPGLLGGPGTCRADTAPRWAGDPEVRLDGRDLTVRGAGTDAGGDVVALQLQLLGEDGTPLSLGRGGAEIAEVVLDVVGQTRFDVAVRASLPSAIAGVVRVKVWLVDARGHACAPYEGEPLALPVGGPGAPCDLDRLTDRCQDATACLDDGGMGRCLAVHAPELERATLHRAPDGLALGLWARGTDADADLRGAWIGVTDDHGRLVAEAVRAFDDVQSGPGGVFEATLSFATQPELQFADALVVLFDAEGLQTDTYRVAVRAPEPVAAEAACDPLGARTTCPEALACVPPIALSGGPSPAEGPHCAEPPSACAEDQVVAEAVGDGAGGYEAVFDLWGASAGIAASCGGGVAQVVVPFTAPADGWWSFALDGEGPLADPVLSLRRHCALAAAFSELACNDDRATGDRQSRVSLRLVAGETVYAVADGYQGADGWWAGAARLHIRPAR